MDEHSRNRSFPRYSCAGAAEIKQDGRLSGWGTVTEISRGGCYIESAHPLTIATAVQLRLTIAGTVVDVGAKVAWITPQVGMGVYFEAVSPEAENQLVQIVEEVTGGGSTPAVKEAGATQPGNGTLRITREAAPEILAKIVKRINEKGVLNKQELIEIVKAHQ